MLARPVAGGDGFPLRMTRPPQACRGITARGGGRVILVMRMRMSLLASLVALPLVAQPSPPPATRADSAPAMAPGWSPLVTDGEVLEHWLPSSVVRESRVQFRVWVGHPVGAFQPSAPRALRMAALTYVRVRCDTRDGDALARSLQSPELPPTTHRTIATRSAPVVNAVCDSIAARTATGAVWHDDPRGRTLHEQLAVATRRPRKVWWLPLPAPLDSTDSLDVASWARQDRRLSIRTRDPADRPVLVVWEYQCTSPASRMISVRHDGEAPSPVYGPWRPVRPGSVGDQLLRYACMREAPPIESIEWPLPVPPFWAGASPRT